MDRAHPPQTKQLNSKNGNGILESARHENVGKTSSNMEKLELRKAGTTWNDIKSIAQKRTRWRVLTLTARRS